MSGFENNTNTGRVEKILDTLALIEKSARSNKAETAQVSALLAPLMGRLAELGVTAGEQVEATPAPVSAPDTDIPRQPQLRADASKISPRDFVLSRERNPQVLMDLIYIATAELDTYLYERGDTRGGKG